MKRDEKRERKIKREEKRERELNFADAEHGDSTPASRGSVVQEDRLGDVLVARNVACDHVYGVRGRGGSGELDRQDRFDDG